ncbi:MAG: DNA polymerase III subunit delta [Deltaproteobacteria bacterium]|nr:MAG: DNA polymerase III subunit delta [Deltaproteobacteria bacterium]
MKRDLFPEHILSEVKRGKFSPFYLFYGENEFYKNYVIEEIRKRFIPDEARELDFQIFYADEMANDLSPVIEFVSSFPFMSDKKVAVLRDIDKIRSSALNTIIGYLNDPVEFACIIFTAQKPDFRVNFFKHIKDSKKAIQFKQFNEFETISWIKRKAKEMGIEMKHEACAYLYYIVGNNLYELNSEIQKLFSCYGKDSILGLDEVKFVASPLKDYTIFDLIDTISSKRLADSLRILNTYLEREGKEKVLSILGMLIRQFTLIQKTKAILQMGGDIKRVQKEVQPYLFLAKKLIKQSHFWTEEDIDDVFLRLSEADAYLKMGLSGSLVLEQLIISICS